MKAFPTKAYSIAQYNMAQDILESLKSPQTENHNKTLEWSINKIQNEIELHYYGRDK